MAYVPTNLQMFNAAYCGALAGMGASDRVPHDTNSVSYAGLAAIAGAFAQQFDATWNDATDPSLLDVYSAQQLSESTWQQRSPVASVQTLTPTEYAELCGALVAMVHAGETYFAGQGIVPPTSGGTNSLQANYWYADPNVAVGGNGSPFLPFNTFQAALNACTAGDIVVLSSGTFAENVVWPNTDNITVNSNNAIVNAAAAGDTLSWVPGTGLTFDRMTINGILTLKNTFAGGRCLVLDGNATAIATIAQFIRVAGTFNRVLLDKTGAGDAAFLRAVSVLDFSNCVGIREPTTGNNAGWLGNATLRNVGYVAFRNCSLGIFGAGGLDYEYDDNVLKPTPFGGRQGVYVLSDSGINGNVILGKTPLFALDQNSVIYGNVSDSGLTTFTGPNHAPVIILLGTVGSPGIAATLTFSLPALIAAAIPFVDLSRGTFYGVVTVSSFALGIARNTVFAKQAKFSKETAGAIVCGADTNLDLREAYFAQAALSAVGNGAIDRSRIRIAAKAVVLAGTACAITPPLPTGATYDVFAEAAVAGFTMGVTAKLVSGFTVTPSLAVTINLDVIRAV